MARSTKDSRSRRLPDPTQAQIFAIPYPRRRRLADRWHGWRDGRKGIPALRTESDGSVDDPPADIVISQMHTMLRDHAFEEVAFERDACIRDCVEPKKKLDQAKGRLGSLREAVEATRSAFQDLDKPDTTEPPQRRSIEEDRPDVTEDLLRRRRLGEYLQSRERAFKKYQEAMRAFEDQDSAARSHLTEIRGRCQAAAERARARWHHFEQRRAVYSQQLVRAHSEGKRLNALLEHAEPDLPEWVNNPDGIVSGFDRPDHDGFDFDPDEVN